MSPLIDERYQVLYPLGKGSFVQTYFVKDIQQPHQPRLVLKVLRALVPGDRRLGALAGTLFDQEVHLLRHLGTYGCIPSLVDEFNEDGVKGLVQEFIEGVSVQDEFNHASLWSEEKLIDFLEAALQVLTLVHGAGVVHRDLKPEHWIWRSQGHELTLIDFGGAQQIKASSDWFSETALSLETAFTIGTCGYMAPEQHQGHADFRSDLYALGMIAIQSITGLAPHQIPRNWQGELHWQPVTPIRIELVDILTRMVRYAPQDRYSAAADILTDLREYDRSQQWSRRFAKWWPKRARQTVSPGMRSELTQVGTRRNRVVEASGVSSRLPPNVLMSSFGALPIHLLDGFSAAVTQQGWAFDRLNGSSKFIETPLDPLAALRSANLDFIFLTPVSIQQPELLQHLQAFNQIQQSGDRPLQLIPIRVNLEVDAVLPDDVRQVLQHIRQYVWRSPADTLHILDEVTRCLQDAEGLLGYQANQFLALAAA